MPSALDALKRKLVSVLLEAARIYNLALNLTRASPDKDVSASYRKVMLKVHPDKPGGSASFATRVTGAHDDWQHEKRNKRPAGRPAQDNGLVVTSKDRKKKDDRIQCAAVLLTWQGFPGVASWASFLDWLRRGLRQWGVKHWTATLESNLDGTLHAHAMFQFHKAADRGVNGFIFEGLRPNASTRDLLGSRNLLKKMIGSFVRPSHLLQNFPHHRD